MCHIKAFALTNKKVVEIKPPAGCDGISCSAFFYEKN